MKLYRYEICHGYDVGLELHEFEVCRETEKCYVIKRCMKDKFVRKDGKSLFAYNTKEKALDNYIRRTIIHIGFLKLKLTNAKLGLYEAKKMMEQQ